MYKKIFCLTLAFSLLCSLAGCGKSGKGLSFDIAAPATGGDLMPGVKALCSVEDVRAAGVPLQDEPLSEATDPDSGLPCITYAVVPPDCTLTIGEHEVYNAQFHFLDGKLSFVNMKLTEKDDFDALESELTGLYGVSTEATGAFGTMLMWRPASDSPVLIQLSAYMDKDGNHTGSELIVGYIWYDRVGQQP